MDKYNKRYGFRTLHRIFDNINDFNSSTFAHHDLSDEKVKDHFKRGIERLNYIKANKIPILFVNVSHDPEFKNNIHEQKLVDSIVNNGFTMKLISIYCTKNVKIPTLCYIDETHIIYTIPSYGVNDIRDDIIIKNILSKHYSFNLLSLE